MLANANCRKLSLQDSENISDMRLLDLNMYLFENQVKLLYPLTCPGISSSRNNCDIKLWVTLQVPSAWPSLRFRHTHLRYLGYSSTSIFFRSYFTHHLASSTSSPERSHSWLYAARVDSTLNPVLQLISFPNIQSIPPPNFLNLRFRELPAPLSQGICFSSFTLSVLLSCLCFFDLM